MNVVEPIIGPVKKLMDSLFPSEIPFGKFNVGLAQEPVLDRYGGYATGEDGHKTYRGLKPTYNTEDEAKDTLRDYAELSALRNTIEQEGISVIKMPYEAMIRKFGRDVIGWREGNTIYYTDMRRGVPLSIKEQIVTLTHEYRSGHNHERTDEEAQDMTIKDLEDYHPEAVSTAQRMLLGARQDPHWN